MSSGLEKRNTLVVKICSVNISPGLNLPEVEGCPRNSAEKDSRLKVALPPPKLTFLLKISIFFKKHLKSVINSLNE